MSSTTFDEFNFASGEGVASTPALASALPQSSLQRSKSICVPSSNAVRQIIMPNPIRRLSSADVAMPKSCNNLFLTRDDVFRSSPGKRLNLELSLTDSDDFGEEVGLGSAFEHISAVVSPSHVRLGSGSLIQRPVMVKPGAYDERQISCETVLVDNLTCRNVQGMTSFDEEENAFKLATSIHRITIDVRTRPRDKFLPLIQVLQVVVLQVLVIQPLISFRPPSALPRWEAAPTLRPLLPRPRV